MCNSCNWEDAAEKIADTIELAEELPERAEDFASSVVEKLNGMAEWVEEEEHVTQKMLDSVENMQAGIERWQR